MKVKYIGKNYLLSDITNGQIYEVLSIEDRMLRIVNDSGEDYLYGLKHVLQKDDGTNSNLWEIVEDNEEKDLKALIIDGVKEDKNIVEIRKISTEALELAKKAANGEKVDITPEKKEEITKKIERLKKLLRGVDKFYKDEAMWMVEQGEQDFKFAENPESNNKSSRLINILYKEDFQKRIKNEANDNEEKTNREEIEDENYKTIKKISKAAFVKAVEIVLGKKISIGEKEHELLEKKAEEMDSLLKKVKEEYKGEAEKLVLEGKEDIAFIENPETAKKSNRLNEIIKNRKKEEDYER